MSGQHCESYDVKRKTVHCYPVNSSLLTAVARNGWNLSAVFKFCFCFVLLYNKSLNDWSLGEQVILFPSNLNVSLDFVSGNIEILGKQNSLFPSGPVIKCLIFNFTRKCTRLSHSVRPAANYLLKETLPETLACVTRWTIALIGTNG